MMWWNHGAGAGGWIVMTLGMVVFWSILVFGVVAIFRGTRDAGSASGRTPRRDPMEILDERFARGEIDADEYHSRRQVLGAVD